MLTETKYNELSANSELINSQYQLQDNGFAKCIATEKELRTQLKIEFKKIGFTALLFTDSRGIFQYFNLSQLWAIIEKAMESKIPVLNVAVEPVTIGEIYSYVYDSKEFKNELNKPVPHFDFKTKYTEVLGGYNGYLLDKQTCLEQIKEYIIKESE